VSRVPSVLLLLGALLALGCASLPQLRVPTWSLRGAAPRVETADGELSRAESARVIEAQDKPGEATVLRRQVAAMRAINEQPWVAGNRVRLLVDGPASYRATFHAIAAARHNVNIESYIVEGEQVEQKLSQLLVKKQLEGVQVNLLYDGIGSLGTSEQFFDSLRATGIHVCEFNPIVPARGVVADPNQRDHRKQVIVDGRIAVSGGINFSDVYTSGSAGGRDHAPSVKSGWRDTNIELRGPAVEQYQQLFLQSWQKQNCAPLEPRSYFPRVPAQGNKLVSVVGTSSDDERRRMYLALVAAIKEARQSVLVTMAYFVPDAEVRDALEDAARRGVDVELILPGFSDSRLVLAAGRSYYAELLDAGVRIHELRGALLHAKTAVIDGVWTTVGSTNLDWRSLLYNDELNTVVLGQSFGQEATVLFDSDLRNTAPIDPKGWEDRGLGPRIEEAFARLIARWL